VTLRRAALLLSIAVVAGGASAGSAAASPRASVRWMSGFAAPGTPARYNRVGVVEVGPRSAKNVLVLEPGTSAGSGYFLPLARSIVSRAPAWQVWSVERRENLLEDQSVLTAAKHGTATSQQAFDYYLGWITDKTITHHVNLLPASADPFAKAWGMSVAVHDLHAVIARAKRLGGTVVLSGHSLGGAVVTAYATWDFGGRPGASDLGGLVLIDGASGAAISAAAARSDLSALHQPSSSPFLSIGGIGPPFAGLFISLGASAALTDPAGPSLAQHFPLLPSELKPPVPATNLGQFGYALNVGTSPASLALSQAHLGRGLTATGGWDGTGALTPIARYADMFAGGGLDGADGSEWYFPTRLALDSGAVGGGRPNPAQSVLGLRAILATKLPHSLRIYAFGAALGGSRVLTAARQLAHLAHIPASHLVLIDRHSAYAHNDPAGAYPHNAFLSGLLPFLRGVILHK
jgi:hypothetical protein